MDRQLSRDLRRELVLVGEIVADEARENQIPQQDLAAGQAGVDGLANSGRLQKGIRSKMRGSAVVVENRAQAGKKSGNYKYPAAIEYGFRGDPRPTLVPALEERKEDVIEALDDMLDRLVSKNGFGRGGIL